MRHQRFVCTRLSKTIHDGIKVPPFNHNVHHRGHWTVAAYGSLKPPPTGRLRRVHLHLSYSMTVSCLLDTTRRYPSEFALSPRSLLPLRVSPQGSRDVY